MLDKIFIKEQVNRLVRDKQYDNRAKPMLIAYFTLLSEKNDYTEEQLINILEKYRSRVDKISYYNIGMTNFKYTKEKELILDREIIEELDETNVEKFLQTIIRVNSKLIFEDPYKENENITEMSAIANLYEYSADIYININEMIANAFEVDLKDVMQLQRYMFEELSKYDREKSPEEYNYYNDSIVILSTIGKNIENIMSDKNVRESYKAIYGTCLLGMKIKVCDSGMITEQSLAHFTKILEKFEQYRTIFNIKDAELENIVLDNNGWKLNCKDILRKLDQQLNNNNELIKSNETNRKREIAVDRKDLIEAQKEENLKIDNRITEKEIKEKVNALIEQKNYPKEFELILHEFFRRSAEEFKWDKETLDKKLENIGRNINAFQFVKMENRNIVAVCNAGNKSIDLNRVATIFSANMAVAATLLHELKHATDKTERGEKIEDGFEHLKQHSFEEANGLNELVTEASTIKILGKKMYSDSFATTYKFKSEYNELCFATSMISSAMGVSESEFIQLASKGENKFKEILETRYPGLRMAERVDEIKESITEIYWKKGLATELSIGRGYAKLYNTLSDLYEVRTNMEKQEGRYDEIKAKYDEYKLNKNMVLAKRKMSLPKKVIAEKVQSYAQIVQKSRIKPNYKKEFAKIGIEMKSEIKERDNRNLVQAGKEIKRTIIKLPSIFWGKRKALEAPKEENPQPQMEKRSFETERAKFLQEVQGSEPMKKTHKNQDNTTERRMDDKGKEANAPKTDDGRFE